MKNNIKRLREQFHLSQDYVAKYLGISRSAINQIENGNQEISENEVTMLCTLFGVPVDALVNINKEEEIW